MKKTLLLLISLFFLAVPAQGAEKKNAVCRFALLAGANNGGPDRKVLKYAISDARSVDRVLAELGGVPDANRILLIEPTREELINGIRLLKQKMESIKDDYSRIELIFYYSGHSDEEGLLLSRERYSYKELKEIIKTIPADMNIMILDSCSSGAFTRIKGGTKVPPFLLDNSMNLKGYAILTSSSADEVSQESDYIGGSFFTHYIVSGLRGAADMAHNGRITLNEVYQYAYQETLSDTEKTMSGPQHPNYDIQMTGSGDVVLTDVRKTSAGLILTAKMQGRYFIRDKDDRLMAEINKKQGNSVEIGLEPGRYTVSLLKEEKYFSGKVLLKKGSVMPLDESVLLEERKELSLGQGTSSTNRAGGPYVSRPWIIAIIPELSLPPFDTEKKTVNQFHLFIVYGKTTVLHGFGLSFAGDVVEERMQGFQFGLAVNYIKGSMRGVQYSLGLNYIKGQGRGLQFGTINIFQPVETQGQGREEPYDYHGPQIGILNISRSMRGAQVGVVNYNGSLKGPMIGVINVSKDLEGVPVGMINVIRNGLSRLFFFVDEKQEFNLEYHSGIKSFYNIFHLGWNGLHNALSTGYGIGKPFYLSRTVDLALELAGSTYHELDRRIFRNRNLLVSLRLALDLRLVRSLTLTAGVSYNYFTFSRTNEHRLKPESIHHYEFPWSNQYNTHWPGFFIGFKF